ncbi:MULTISPECIES: hypothetical protein [unclassified Hyphomicrobium]|nr:MULTISPECIES: hypothetical protein [unclassified Hyphomicrobium]
MREEDFTSPRRMSKLSFRFKRSVMPTKVGTQTSFDNRYDR